MDSADNLCDRVGHYLRHGRLIHEAAAFLSTEHYLNAVHIDRADFPHLLYEPYFHEQWEHERDFHTGFVVVCAGWATWRRVFPYLTASE